MAKKSKFTGFSLFVSIIAAIGGILFGYNTSVISGALGFVSSNFNLSTFEQEILVSIILVGAFLGAWFGGVLADRVGRRNSFFVTTILFFIGIIMVTTTHALSILYLGRIFIGFAVGIVSVVTPLYIAEMSDPTHRGALVSLNQFAITIGILLGYIIGYVYSDSGEWRSMFAAGMIPTAILFIGLFFIPETPSYLIMKGKKVKAQKILRKIRIASEDDEVTSEGKKSSHNETVKWKHLFEKSVRPALFIGIMISIFQQITGINTVIYYAPKIFALAGFESAPSAMLASVGVGTVNVIMTIVALWLIDILGRRPLLIIGLIGMVVSLGVLGLAFMFSTSEIIGVTSVISLMCYVAFFAIGIGPVAWLIISEIYPMGIRGRAMGVAIFFNWAFNYIVSLTFLTLISVLGASGAFFVYAVVGLFALWFVLVKVPETKGKTLQQIQKILRKRS